MVNKYGIVKVIASFSVAAITLYGVILGIAQYYQSRPRYDLTGEWVLQLKIESTSYRAYQDLTVGYKLYLIQAGQEISGKGEKWWENGKELPFSQHDPINVSGLLKGKRLPLSFTLKGTLRETVGVFDLSITNRNELSGTFSTTGANSRGSAVLSRGQSGDT